MSTIDKELLDTPLDRLTYTVFDIETTGIAPDKGDRIVEIAALKILPGFKIDRKNTFQTLVNPEIPIPERAVNIHGITDKAVEKAPDSCSALYSFFDFARGSIPAAHRASKDLAYIRAELRLYSMRNPLDTVIDTLRMSRRLYPEQSSHSLDAIEERLNFTPSTRSKRHRALYDAECTAVALRGMLKRVFEEKFYLLGELVNYLK